VTSNRGWLLTRPPSRLRALAAHSSRTGQRAAHYLQLGGIFVALGLIWLGLSFASPYFFTSRNILNILLQASTIAIIAAGSTIVLIAAEIDLSVGSVEALSGSLAAVMVIKQGVPVALGIVLGLGIGLLAGLVNGYVTVYARIPSFIVTLAMLGIAHGAALLMTGGYPVAGFPHAYSVIGQGKVGPIPVPVIIAAVVYLFLYLLLGRTRFGVELYATGGGRLASQLAGIRTTRIVFVAFAASGLLAGLGGVILSSRLDAGHGEIGSGDLLDAIASVVIGGTSLMGGVGSVVGTLAGVLIITSIRNGLVLLNVQAFWQEIVVGGIILLAVVIDQVAKGRLRFGDLVPRPARR
jgi:ribose transport system permease protein